MTYNLKDFPTKEKVENLLKSTFFKSDNNKEFIKKIKNFQQIY